MTTLIQADLIDTRSALQYIFVDKNEAQLDEMFEKIQIQKAEKLKVEQSKKEPLTSEKSKKEEGNTDINHIKKVE